MNKQNENFFILHLAVFLMSFVEPLGRIITSSIFIIVFGRALFSAISLLVFIVIHKKTPELKFTKDHIWIVILSSLAAIDWLGTFQSLKASNVAITTIAFSIFPIAVTLLEPIIHKEKFYFKNLIPALIIGIGVILIIPKFDFGNNITQGVIWGGASGLAFGMLSIFNRKYVKKHSSFVISFYQNLGVMVILFPFIIQKSTVFSFNDVIPILLLGVVCTAIAHTLFIKSLTTIKAQTCSIVENMGNIYSILLAIFILGEIPNTRVIAGGLIILGTSLYITFVSRKPKIAVQTE